MEGTGLRLAGALVDRETGPSLGLSALPRTITGRRLF